MAGLIPRVTGKAPKEAACDHLPRGPSDAPAGFICGRIFTSLNAVCPCRASREWPAALGTPTARERVADVFLQVVVVLRQSHQPRIDARISAVAPDEWYRPVRSAAPRIGCGRPGRLNVSGKQLRRKSSRETSLRGNTCRSRTVVRRCWTSGRYRRRSTRAGFIWGRGQVR